MEVLQNRIESQPYYSRSSSPVFSFS